MVTFFVLEFPFIYYFAHLPVVVSRLCEIFARSTTVHGNTKTTYGQKLTTRRCIIFFEISLTGFFIYWKVRKILLLLGQRAGRQRAWKIPRQPSLLKFLTTRILFLMWTQNKRVGSRSSRENSNIDVNGNVHHVQHSSLAGIKFRFVFFGKERAANVIFNYRKT